jgi:hypothetical protein
MENGPIPLCPIRRFRIPGFPFPVSHSFFDTLFLRGQGEGMRCVRTCGGWTMSELAYLKIAENVDAGPLAAPKADDAVLKRAGILPYFADFVEQTTSIPDYAAPPRPRLNRPFPADLP